MPGPELEMRIDDENVTKVVPASGVHESQGESTQDISLRAGTQHPPPQK